MLKGLLVGRLHKSFPRQNGTIGDAIHQAPVHRGHSDILPALDDGANIRDRATADRIGQGLMLEQNLMHGDAPFGLALTKQLRHHPGQTSGEHHAHLILLISRKRVNDAVDGLRRIIGVERAKNQHAHGGTTEREFDGLELSHFSQ